MTCYVSGNPKTKKAIREALARGEELTVTEMTTLGANRLTGDHAQVAVCGPHYPAPHKWYGGVRIKDGKIEKVIE